MAELFKYIYNEVFFDTFTSVIQQIIPDFDKKSFIKDIYDKDWEKRELKQRMRHITNVLKIYLSHDFDDNVETILKLIPLLEENASKYGNLEFIFFPDFIEVYGSDNYLTSIRAFETITQFISCEFAVRPFIIRYKETMIKQMLDWSNHKHPAVRRLASEGSRPRLPWAMAIPSLKETPSSIIPLLENLKNDQSESVRRSVANNLNDISKDHPDLVIKMAKSWQGESLETDRLIKHACRTLLKQGNAEVMDMFGFGSVDKIRLIDFLILTPRVKIGQFLEFTFRLVNASHSFSKIRLEYGMYYQKANGTLSKKVFLISEKNYPEKSTTTINRRQSFKIITTRKFHPGLHQVSIIINGIEMQKKDFELVI
jgi:3-methyladenine DNA glycosylase AlkC